MSKELKETMSKELNESSKMMSHQIETINKETGIVGRNQVEILELKSTITDIKNSLKGLNSRFEQSEERISQLESRSIEIIQSEV